MIYGFNEKKEKKKVLPSPTYVGEYSGISWSVFRTVTGDEYYELTAPADGYIWGEVDAAISGASIVSSYGTYVKLFVNNVKLGQFYADTNTKKYTTPSFPVKAGDVIKIQNGYTENTIGVGLRGVETE